MWCAPETAYTPSSFSPTFLPPSLSLSFSLLFLLQFSSSTIPLVCFIPPFPCSPSLYSDFHCLSLTSFPPFIHSHISFLPSLWLSTLIFFPSSPINFFPYTQNNDSHFPRSFVFFTRNCTYTHVGMLLLLFFPHVLLWYAIRPFFTASTQCFPGHYRVILFCMMTLRAGLRLR